MKFICPNKNSSEWKALVEAVGLTKAYKAFINNNYNIPVIEKEVNDKTGEALIEALSITTHRIKLIEASVKKTDRADKELEELKELEGKLVDYILNNNYKEGLLFFSQQMSADIETIRQNLSINTSSNKLKSSRVRSALTYIDSVIPMIDSITTFLVEKPNKDKEELEIFGTLSSKRAVLQKLREDAVNSGREVFAILIEPFLGDRNNKIMLDEINKNLPPNKRIKEFDLLSSLTHGQNDINLLERWLKSMANTPDELLKLTNELVMRKKSEARLKALEDKYALLDLRTEYFKNGGKNFDWVYEKKKDGTLTGNFIDERRYTEYNEDLFKFKRNLLEKKGVKSVTELSIEDRKEYVDSVDQWKEENSELIRVSDIGGTKMKRVPILSKYGNKDYQKLTSLEKEILTKIKNMKEDLDSRLHPKFRNPHRVPQVAKDFFERMKDVKNKGQVREVVMQEYLDRDYDTDQGNRYNVDDATVEYVLSDRGREQNLLPMHFTKKLENMNRDLSLDIISSMVVYSHMSRDYEAMDDIVDTLEVGREILRERKTPETGFGGALKKTISYVAGNRIEKNLFKENTLALQRFEDFLDMVVYGKTRIKGKTIKILGKTVETKEEAIQLINNTRGKKVKVNGVEYTKEKALEFVSKQNDDGKFKIGGIQFDREKSIDLLGKYTAVNALALNIYAGIANLGIGETVLFQESMAGRNFNMKDWTSASINYWSDLPAYLAQHGKVHNTSKLALWSDRFDPLQDYQSEKHQTDSMRKTWIARSFKMSSLFFINNSGEHFMQTRTSLALANATKLKDKYGNEISLYDAYEAHNGRLRLKEGVTKLDGSEWTTEDEIAFQRKQDFINQRMHGIYNENDKAALQKYALGRLAMMFRKFIMPGIDRRWERANYNYMLGDFTEGYYMSAGIFFGNVIKDLAHMKFSLMSNWNNLSDLRKQNMIKFMTEMSTVLALMILLNFFLGADDDGSDDWEKAMAEYQARRLITELMFFLNPLEALKIVRSPAAAMTSIDDFGSFLGSVMNPLAWDDKLETGRYKDWYKWQRSGLKLLPFYKTIDKALHPEESVRWWKQ